MKSPSSAVFEESYEYRLLRRLLQLITPLHLVDPKSKDFRPANCTSYHDITRYIHEKAVEELIRLSELHGQNASASPPLQMSASPGADDHRRGRRPAR